jgi:hypothetical protein
VSAHEISLQTFLVAAAFTTLPLAGPADSFFFHPPRTINFLHFFLHLFLPNEKLTQFAIFLSAAAENFSSSPFWLAERAQDLEQ